MRVNLQNQAPPAPTEVFPLPWQEQDKLFIISCLYQNAGMAELADALDLGSSAARRAGSSPVPGTSNPPLVASLPGVGITGD